MKREGVAGSIVNIGSMTGYGGQVYLFPYAISKGALHILTKNAYSLMWDRIRVNLVNLGWMDTPNEHIVQREVHGGGEDWLEKAEAEQPFGRLIARTRRRDHLLPPVRRVRDDDRRLHRLRPVRQGRRRHPEARPRGGLASSADPDRRAGLRPDRALHAELIAKRVPGLALGRVFDVRREPPTRSPTRWAPRSPKAWRSSSRLTTSTPSPSARRPTPTSICSSRARPPEAHLLREALSLDLAEVDRDWRPWMRPACCCRSASTAATTPATARSASGGRRHRPAPPGAHHEPRPGASAHRLHRGVGRDLLRHDHPRLRHGPP